MRLEFIIPARGLFGYRTEFLTDTKGEGVMSSVFNSYQPYKGDIQKRTTGSLIAFEAGELSAMACSTHRIAARCLSAPARWYTKA